MSRKPFVPSTLSLAVALSLAGGDVCALGVGAMRVQSALNQPFAAEVELLDIKPDELDSVKAQLAGVEEFAKSGAERYHYLTKLRFAPEVSPRGYPVVRISSREPIREPYMDFLLEVVSPKGRVVREFTLLLDPPSTTSRSAERIERPPVSQRTMPAQTESSSLASLVGPASKAASPAPTSDASEAPSLPPVASPGPGFPKYVGPVGAGTGLWRLAQNNTTGGATAAQTAMALFRNNQGAFIRGNINRLIAGKTLVIPSSAELMALSPDAAQRELQVALRGQPVRRTPVYSTAGADSRLKIAGAPPPMTPGSVPAPGQAQGSGVEQTLLQVQETSESNRQETVELRGRIRELETQLTEIQKLLQLRSAELARYQEAPGAGVPPGAGEQAGGQPAAGASAVTGTQSGQLPASPPAAAPLPVTPAGQATPETATPPAVSAAAPVAPVAQTQQEPPAKPAAPPKVAQEPVKPPRQPVPAPQPAPEESSWRALLMPLAGIAGVSALGIGVLVWLRSRRRTEQDGLAADAYDFYEDRGGRTGDAESNVTLASEAEAAVGRVKAPSSTLSDLSASQTRTDEADAISEADIYIAYGRYREAEDLLREALEIAPGRLDVKVKLAETYAGARNRSALQTLLEELRGEGLDRSDPDRWQRLQALGRSVPVEEETAAVRVPAKGAAPSTSTSDGRPASEPASELDSLALESHDILSLDLIDGRASSGGAHAASLSGDSDSDSLARDPLLSELDLERLERGGPPSTNRIPSSFPGDDGLRMDDQPFSRHLSLDTDLDGLGLDFPGGSTPSIDRGASEESLSSIGRKSPGRSLEPDLTAAELHDSSELDLGSYLAVSETAHLDDALALGRPERSSSRGTLPPLRTGPSSTTVARDRHSALSGLFGGQDESASSDLLSSQWQMDSGLWDETATKLDLARAYVEMGDRDSARGILEEVVGEGSEEQRGEARELLRRLG